MGDEYTHIAADTLSFHLNERLRPEYRKLWVQYVYLKKRTPFMFIIFPHGHGDYRMHSFELKPALAPYNPTIEGDEFDRYMETFSNQLEEVVQSLNEYVD